MAKGNKSPSMAVQEKSWQAQDDCRVLAQAVSIKKDQARLKAAAQAAKGMVDDKQRELQGLKQVARKAGK